MKAALLNTNRFISQYSSINSAGNREIVHGTSVREINAGNEREIKPWNCLKGVAIGSTILFEKQK